MNMKITLGELRSLIRESMVSALGDNQSVEIKTEGGRSITISIKEVGKPRAHSPGVITLQRVQVPDGIIWEVVNSAAQKGYGPLLYDLTMEYVVNELGDLGLTCDTTSVSGEAQRVWNYYLNNRPDVEHELLPEKFRHAKDRPEPLQYYYYKMSSTYLDQFRDEGKLEIVEE